MARRSQPGPAHSAPSYLTATLVAVAIAGLYLATLAPTTALWDTSEYITAAYTMGLPHPPGNPLFVLLGRVFTILPLARSIAVRVNILAALASAASAGLWFLVTEQVLSAWVAERWIRRLGAAFGALIGATAFTVWNQSVVNEKVYTVALAGIAAISWLAMRWSRDPDAPGAGRLLVLIAYLCGLGYANHMAGCLPAPAVLLAVLARRPRTLSRWRLLLACTGALALGVTPFATQPIRAAFHPPLNEGEPTACRTGLHLSCTLSAGTYKAFLFNFNREQYGKPALMNRQAPFTAQVGMWWYYFTWQWMRDPHGEHPRQQLALALTFLLLGIAGARLHWRHDRSSAWYFITYMATVSIVLVYYLNFKYGATQPSALAAVEREVRDRDYFFIWSFSPWGIWVALALIAAWRSCAARLGAALQRAPSLAREPDARLRAVTLAVAAPILLLAIEPLASNWTAASRRGDTTALAFAHDLLESVEPYGVLITYGDNDTFPLWYAQDVEGIRKDVTVAVLSLLNTDWYVRGIVRRPIYPYDAAHGPAIYRGRKWPMPSGSPLHMTLAQADAIPDYLELREPAVLQKAGLRVRVDPRNLPQLADGGGVLERKDIVVLRMIADSWPERPIYISRTTGDYAQRMGLGDSILAQGLANKVFLPPAASGSDTLHVRGGGWYDVARSRALWGDVFQGRAAIIHHGDWVDASSVGIPLAYAFTGAQLAEVLAGRGERASASAVMQTSVAIVHAVHQDGLLGRSAAAPEPDDR
ncbi:MAG: glycosyltransferase family 117 protein [Gemmatimonadaceae bacterium]